MDIRLEEIEKRLSEITIEVDKEDADLNAIEKEVSELKEERNKIKAEIDSEISFFNKRKATAEGLTAGTIKADNSLDILNLSENREGAKTMENEVITNGTEEYRNAWLSKMMGKEVGEVEQRALVTASGAIPTQTMDKIVEQMEYIAPILAKVDLTRIPSNLSIPVESTVNDASWVAMGTASTDSADALTTVSLAAYKLIKTVEIGADVEVMAIPTFESYLVNKLAEKMAKALENAVINGTGSSQPTGLLASGIITNTGTFTNAAMTYADLLTIIGDLPDHGYRAGATLIMPSALFYSDVLPALTDKGSGLDVQAAEKMKVLGYDVVLCDRVAADTIIFGNLKNYAMNIASDVKVEADKSVAFRTGSTVYRAMALVDGKPVNVAAFNTYTRAAS